jgi:uncharacterized protein YdhG (YjbR/CyaY superfamily)
MQSKARTVAACMAEQSVAARAELNRVRALVKEVAPAAVECMRYGMPSYEQSGSLLFSFAAQRNYLALYVLDPQVVAKYRRELGGLSSGKGCIRFRRYEQLPGAALRRLMSEAVARRDSGVTEGPCHEPVAAAARRRTSGIWTPPSSSKS